MKSEQTNATLEQLLEDLDVVTPTHKRGAVRSLDPDVVARRLANPQMFENSSESGSFTEHDGLEEGQALYNAKPPSFIIKSEKPEHRTMVLLKLAGHSNNEIAEVTGKTPAWVSNVLRQPWARAYITQELVREGRDVLHELLANEAENSVMTLIEVRDSEKTKPETKVQAANALLNRLLGNPTQPISHSGHVNMDNVSDADLAKIALSGAGGM